MSTSGSKKGRPEILTDEIQAEIVKALNVGAYVETAAAVAGIHKDTFYEWLKRGARAKRAEKHDESDEKYIAFSDAVKRTMANSEVRDVALIARAAESNWTAAAWRLERKFPDRWGRRDRAELEVKGTLGTMDIPPNDQTTYLERLGKFFGNPDEILMDGTSEPSDSGRPDSGD